MTTGVRTAPWATSGNAAWQAWCDAIYNSIVDSGWVQTSDTGQRAVPASDSYPVASNTFTYWVFRLNDSQQSACPVFMKFEVSRGNTSSNAMIRITIGTGSNGAGSIQNPVVLQAVHGTSSWSPTQASPGVTFVSCVKSGAAWGVTLDESPGYFFYVGRTLDSSGTVTSDGFIAVGQPLTNSKTAGVWDNQTKTIVPNAGLIYPMPATLISGIRTGSGGIVPVFAPRYRITAGIRQFAGAYGISRQELPAGGTYSINQFSLGAETYMSLSAQAFNTPPVVSDAGGQASAGLLMVWG